MDTDDVDDYLCYYCGMFFGTDTTIEENGQKKVVKVCPACRGD